MPPLGDFQQTGCSLAPPGAGRVHGEPGPARPGRRPGGPLTHAARDRVVPLGQGVGHRPAAHGRGALQQVPRAALEPDDGPRRELGADPPAVPGLGDGAALGVAGPGNRCGQSTGHGPRCLHGGRLKVHLPRASGDTDVGETQPAAAPHRHRAGRGASLQPRDVPWAGVEPGTLPSAGRRSGRRANLPG